MPIITAAPTRLIDGRDRVVHHSVIRDLMGIDSYRAREATLQHAPPLPPEPGPAPEASIGEAA